jgi:DNA primase catalytic core
MKTDEIHDTPIYDIISRYITLNKAGVNYKGCCPIHDEKTPSMFVFPRTNTFKCFGCGVGGDAIKFVMLHKHFDFIEACKTIAKDHALTIDLKSDIPYDPEANAKREKLFSIMRMAQQFFVDQLRLPENENALIYVKERFSEDIIVKWSIGYAPDSWQALSDYAISKGHNIADLMAVGLVSQKNDKTFDTFRNRIMFPITNESGSIIAFSGRVTPHEKDPKTPKFINSRETEIYSKSKSFYGITTAINEIRKTKHAYLVEGNPDVIRMQEVGPINTIAPLGTGLTDQHVTFIAKYCTRVTIIGDGDAPGMLAVDNHAVKFINAGLFVNVITLPMFKEKEKKEDPDSFFAKTDFYEYEAQNISDYILWFCKNKATLASKPDQKQQIIAYVSDLIGKFSSSTQELYIEQVSAIIKPKKAWTDELKQINKLNAPDEKKEDNRFKIPEFVKADDFEKFGFYEDDNQYFFNTKNGVVRGSNFTMKPLFHVQSVIDSKRLFEIKNEFGYSQIIEFMQKDLVSMQSFRLRVESLGNFLWEASEIELNKLKRYIYEKTETCTEIKQLGWQKHGFWAWGNGIYNGQFSKVNEFGIVRHHDTNYYIPAFSKIYEREDSLFVAERKFIHMPGQISMAEVVFKLETVFGQNARIAYCFFLATCYRDIIANRFGFFPVLNLFGPKGAGKTEMAISMLHFFGKLQKGPNINNTSKAALADHVAQHANALCHIDEYKNNVEFEKIEFLKGIWDGTGRTRMNMEKDKKKETTNVDIGLMLTGQEMPTADIALFSRLIFLTFNQTEYSDTEKTNFNDLKVILNAGVTHLTHQVLSHREHFLNTFFESYDFVCTQINSLLDDQVIEDRIFRNWAIILAAFHTLADKVPVNFSFKSLLEMTVPLILRQNSETKKTNDVANFWEIFNFLVKERELLEKVDFLVKTETKVNIGERNYDFTPPADVIYLNHTRIFQKYRKHGASTRDFVLPIKTLEFYLMNSKEYLGKKLSCPFIMKEGESSDFDMSGKVKRQITTAHAFHYENIVKNYGINVITTQVDDENNQNLPGTTQQPQNDLFNKSGEIIPPF